MNFSGFIDVAIGLMLMYFVLSLICTTVNEFIATWLRWRAASLSKAITRLIDDPELLKTFYGNGLIENAKTASRGGDRIGDGASARLKALFGTLKSLMSAAGNDSGAKAAAKDGQPTDHPSYLDGRTFAMALLQSLVRSFGKNKKDTAPAQSPDLRPAVVPAVGQRSADPATSTATPAPLGPESRAGTATPPSVSPMSDPMSFDVIKDIVEDLSPSFKMRDVLLASITTASSDITALRDEIAKWFDAMMDRLSGDYKRDMKRLSLIIGLLVAFIFNADSLSVGKSLWADETLRTQLVNAAATTVQNRPAAAKCDQPDPGQATKCLLARLQDQEQQLRPFPIGWSTSAWASTWEGANFLAKLLGLIWTGIALSLGAPFWFDLLQKFMNIRGTGPKPESTEEKANKEKAGGE